MLYHEVKFRPGKDFFLCSIILSFTSQSSERTNDLTNMQVTESIWQLCVQPPFTAGIIHKIIQAHLGALLFAPAAALISIKNTDFHGF